MEIYIEYVVIDNLIINYILLLLSGLIVKCKISKVRVFVATVVGVIGVVVFPYIALHFNLIMLLLYKIFLSIVMVVVAYGIKRLKQFASVHFVFLSLTFVLGGCTYALLNLTYIDATVSGCLLFGFEIPIGVIVGFASLYLWLIYFAIKKYKMKFAFEKFYCNVEVHIKGRIVKLQGFVDSGHSVQLDNKSVLIVGYGALLQFYPDINLSEMIVGENSSLQNVKYISILNSSGTSKMMTFTVDEVKFYNGKNNVVIYKDQVVGLSNTNFKNKFDCLVSPLTFG